MKTTPFVVATILGLGLVVGSAGEISGTIHLKGTPPAEKPITPLKEDPNCGKLHSDMPTTHFYVVDSSGGLADVVVSLQGVSGKSKGAAAEPVVLDQKGCEYSPQIFAVQTNQKILVKNSDPVLHNIHDVPAANSGNPEKNEAQMPGSKEMAFSFPKPEMFLKFKCDVHPWMFAWVSVFDHPYFAVSGKDGTFTIKDVPPGKYKIEAAHRKAGTTTQEIEVKEGAPAKVDFELTAK